MVAVAYPMTDPWVASRPPDPALADCSDWADRLNRPGAAVYRRRRAAALLALAAVALTTVLAVQVALAGSGGGALTTSGSSGAAGPVAGHVYVVQPGDTLWGIVEATGYRGDPRPEVDRLALQLDGRPLQPGQRLQIP